MPSDGAGGRSGGDGDRGSGGSTSGERGGGGRGGGGRNKDAFGFNSLSPSRTSSGHAIGTPEARAGASGNSNTPQGLRSIADMQAGLNIAGPQLSRARDNAVATNLARGLTALGMVTGFPGFSIASALTKAARDYGRGYADRTDMEKAADALGMGAPTPGGDGDAPKSGGLSGVAKQQSKAPAKAPARAAASGNVGSGAAGATVIMGADKTRTGAGAGGRAKGSAVRGFGTGGLKI